MKIERKFRKPTKKEEDKIIDALVTLLQENYDKGGKDKNEKSNNSD